MVELYINKKKFLKRLPYLKYLFMRNKDEIKFYHNFYTHPKDYLSLLHGEIINEL
jgi:hypothetical protein